MPGGEWTHRGKMRELQVFSACAGFTPKAGESGRVPTRSGAPHASRHLPLNRPCPQVLTSDMLVGTLFSLGTRVRQGEGMGDETPRLSHSSTSLAAHRCAALIHPACALSRSQHAPL